jgi:hypothetical protein
MEPIDVAPWLQLSVTAGSFLWQVPLNVDKWLPTLQECVMAFNRLNSHKSRLTVGGKAFSKHAHRAQSDTFWGISTGKEMDKNRYANAALARILNHSQWRNVFMLPHNVVAYEVRNAQGYGARWTIQDNIVLFRGFVEPMMEDGHAVGWIH